MTPPPRQRAITRDELLEAAEIITERAQEHQRRATAVAPSQGITLSEHAARAASLLRIAEFIGNLADE